jgi:hypothetical protein
MTTPHRLRLTDWRYDKGGRKPEDAVSVDRSTKWGNPFKVGPSRSQAVAVAEFRTALLAGRLRVTADEVRRELRGKHLACWCKLDTPCHADVLLEVANAPEVKP